ncbi:MAG: Rad52/Rad22 family DNA repair protein [Cyanophyceae cyanobacterium]
MQLAEILERLHHPIPNRSLSTKRLSGTDISYVSWYVLCDLLDERCGIDGWEWKQIDCQQIGNKLTQTWELTVIGSDRRLSRQATGDENIDTSNYGSPTTNVEAQCLRRCCSKFGLGRDLWRKSQSKASFRRQPQQHKVTPISHKQGQISREEWLTKFGTS